MSYIPDITERFPEGFGGVDMTDRYFPSRRTSWEDWSEAELIGYDDIPYETEPKPKRFEIGQHYMWTDWFTGGQSYYVVAGRTNGRLALVEYRRELDGEYKGTENFKILTDENGNEYLHMCEYRGEEGRLYAEEVEA
jgi:hypothetical protein